MSVLTINAFPSTATITATYNEETITGIGQVVIEANDSTVVSYTVEAQQCTSKSGTFTISGDMTEAVALNYIGSVSVDTWVPSTGRDTFPTHIAMLGKGGWRSVESNDERDAIPSARREAGMSVYVTSTNKVYILDDDLVTWNELESGKVDDVRLHNVSVVNNKIANLETVRQVTTLPVEPLVAGEIVQYIGNTNANYTNGYFYKQTSRNTTYSNLQFIPLGDYEIDVTISDEDLNTFLNETVRQTDYPVVSGRFGYYQQTPNVLWYLSGTSGHQFDGFSYSNTPEGYAEQGFTVTPPIGPQQGLDYTVENTTTWVWEQVDVQPNPEVYESFFRGRWDNWNIVPSNASLYPEDYHESTIPTKNDYMVVTDASDYIGGYDQPINITTESTRSITIGSQTKSLAPTQESKTEIVEQGVTFYAYCDYSNVLHIEVGDKKVLYNDVLRQNVQIYQGNPTTANPLSITVYYSLSDSMSGSWRFRYTKEWGTAGKSGWTPEYQLENVLPIASDTQPGIVQVDGTTITADVNGVISATAKESFYRGKFGKWSQVPTDSTQYDPEPGTQDKTTPTINDFMVIADASDYAGVEVDVFTNEGATVLNEYWSSTDFLPVSPGTYAKVNYTRSYGQSARGQISLYTENKTLLYSRECQTTTGSGDYTDEFQLPNNCYYVKVQYMTNYDTTEVLTLGGEGMFTGSWRFYYSGVWSTDGKSGWKPQYQIENTLPIATDTQLGVVKVDNSTIVVDAEGTISATTGETFYRGKFRTWSQVPLDQTQYEEDIHGSTTPTPSDFIVVDDASDYGGGTKDVWSNEGFTDAGGGWCYSDYLEVVPGTFATAQYHVNVSFTCARRLYLYRADKSLISYEQLQTTTAAGDYEDSITLPNECIYVRFYFLGPSNPNWTDTNIHILTLGTPGQYTGAWRFMYGIDKSWGTDGKTGWVPQYQVESVLPIADSQTLGIAKLYTTTGQNTDGSVTQKLVTTELGKKQDTLTAGTGIDISTDASTGNLVISNTSTESFFRGPFADWASVPTSASDYYPDIYGNKTPKNTDYIIIEDASQVPSGGTTVSMTMRTDVYSSYPTQELTTVIGSESYTGTGIFGGGEIEVTAGVVIDGWYCVVWKNLKNEVVFGGTTYPIGSDFNIVRIQPPFSGTSTATLGISYPYSGTWRFSYRGQWNLEGRGGWKGEYAVEETLPIATDQIAGIMKLYTTTGSNTDGTMDQSSITIELGNKQDVLTNASNAGEGIIIDDVTQEISTNNIVWRKW